MVAYCAGGAEERNCFHFVISSVDDGFAWGAVILHADSSTVRSYPATPGLQWSLLDRLPTELAFTWETVLS